MAAQENSGVSVFQAKGFRANLKVSWSVERWHRGSNKSIVAQQKMMARWNQNYRDATKEGSAVKFKILYWIWKKASRQRRHDRGGFERRHLGRDDTIVVNLKESILLASRTSVQFRKIFTPILKAKKSISAKHKSWVKSKTWKSKKQSGERNKSCTEIRKERSW
jgi:hypothetical protein